MREPHQLLSSQSSSPYRIRQENQLSRLLGENSAIHVPWNYFQMLDMTKLYELLIAFHEYMNPNLPFRQRVLD